MQEARVKEFNPSQPVKLDPRSDKGHESVSEEDSENVWPAFREEYKRFKQTISQGEKPDLIVVYIYRGYIGNNGKYNGNCRDYRDYIWVI